MISIRKAKESDLQLLANLGKTSFIESHGSSAAATDINSYVNASYTPEAFKKELDDLKNIYHLVYYKDQPAGYSKIVFDAPHVNIAAKNVTKLDRIYLLKEFYGLKTGAELFKFNLELSKKNDQAGMWLFVWKDNQRAVRFYEKAGFGIIGAYDFKLTENHANPNHHMFLNY